MTKQKAKPWVNIWRNNSGFLLLMFAALLFYLSLYLWPQNASTVIQQRSVAMLHLNTSHQVAQYIRDEYNTNATRHSNRTYSLVMWTNVYGRRPAVRDEAECGGVRCRLLQRNGSLSDDAILDQADAVIIHMFDVKSVAELPGRRLPRHTWIYLTIEPPTHPRTTQFFNRVLNNKTLSLAPPVFNATMTYSRFADITEAYGSFETLAEGGGKVAAGDENKLNALVRGKRKLAAWFVSQCETQSQRERYVQELRKHAAVDVYGACGNLTCEREGQDSCLAMLERGYLFYLAFENSLCTDYITEKLWRLLRMRIVPVVLGGADYSALLPPHSYIDVRDFESPRHLAEYLYTLQRNPRLYARYFAWRRAYRVLGRGRMCRVCRYMQSGGGGGDRSATAGDLQRWWSVATQCQTPQQYYQHQLAVT